MSSEHTMLLRLENPALKWIDSYRATVAEFESRGEMLIPFVMRIPNRDSEAFLQRLRNCAKGIGISDGFVPHETYWLVADDREVVGVSNLRLHLNESLLKDGGHIGIGVRPSYRRLGLGTRIIAETLVKAREHGIERALLTCVKSNTPSAGAIRKNGGVLESEEMVEGRDELIQRYWIAI